MDGKLRNMTSIYLRKGNQFLLLYRMGSRVVGNSYTGTAGGHFEQSELNDAKACVLRELLEETGLLEQDITKLSLRYITLRLKSGEVRQNYYFFADLAGHVNVELLASNEGELHWFSPEEMESLTMPHSAKFVVQHYLKTGQHTSSLYGGIAEEDRLTFIELKEF